MLSTKWSHLALDSDSISWIICEFHRFVACYIRLRFELQESSICWFRFVEHSVNFVVNLPIVIACVVAVMESRSIFMIWFVAMDQLKFDIDLAAVFMVEFRHGMIWITSWYLWCIHMVSWRCIIQWFDFKNECSLIASGRICCFMIYRQNHRFAVHTHSRFDWIFASST